MVTSFKILSVNFWIFCIKFALCFWSICCLCLVLHFLFCLKHSPSLISLYFVLFPLPCFKQFISFVNIFMCYPWDPELLFFTRGSLAINCIEIIKLLIRKFICYDRHVNTMFSYIETNLLKIVWVFAIFQLLGWLFNDALDIDTVELRMANLRETGGKRSWSDLATVPAVASRDWRVPLQTSARTANAQDEIRNECLPNTILNRYRLDKMYW